MKQLVHRQLGKMGQNNFLHMVGCPLRTDYYYYCLDDWVYSDCNSSYSDGPVYWDDLVYSDDYCCNCYYCCLDDLDDSVFCSVFYPVCNLVSCSVFYLDFWMVFGNSFESETRGCRRSWILGLEQDRT